MAVDPATGQSIVTPAFDQNLAAFLNPQAFGQLQAQQGQLGQQGQLAQAMMSQGYTPNSGFAGALTQGAQAMMGMVMLKKSQEQQGQLYQQMLQQMSDAKKAQHDQMLADKQKEADIEAGKTVSIHKGEGDYDLSVAGQQNQNAASKAGLVASAELPSKLAVTTAEGKNSANAAYIGATAGQQQKVAEMKAAGATPEMIKAALVGPDAYSMAGTGMTKGDQAAIDRRIPDLQKTIDQHQTALGLVNEMQQKLASGSYDNAGKVGFFNQAVSKVPVMGQAFQTTGGQELGSDAANLVLAAQSAMNSGSGGRGSMLQLKTLQQGKPSTDKGPEANMAALDTIKKSLEGSLGPAQQEMAHYGSGGTPRSWAATQAAQAAQQAASSGGPKVVRTGTAPDGSKVAQFDDGSIGPAP